VRVLARAALGAMLAASLAAPARALDLEATAGVSESSFGGEHFPTASTRNGITVGVAGRWTLAPHFSVRSGLQYVERGAVLGSEDFINFSGVPSGALHVTDELAYAEVPALLGWSPAASGGVRLTLFGGPAIAFKLSEWLHETGAIEVKIRRDDLQDEDVLGVLGAGLETLIDGQRLMAEASYDQGLVNVLRPEAGDDTLRNTGLRVRVGVAWTVATHH